VWGGFYLLLCAFLEKPTSTKVTEFAQEIIIRHGRMVKTLRLFWHLPMYNLLYEVMLKWENKLIKWRKSSPFTHKLTKNRVFNNFNNVDLFKSFLPQNKSPYVSNKMHCSFGLHEFYLHFCFVLIASLLNKYMLHLCQGNVINFFKLYSMFVLLHFFMYFIHIFLIKGGRGKARLNGLVFLIVRYCLIPQN
jgi:hypothetical protein